MKSLRFVLLILVLCVFLLLLGHGLLELSSLHRLSQILVDHAWVFALWRYTLYVVIILLWPYFIGFWGKRQSWDRAVVQYLSNQRLKVFGVLVLIEILFGYNLLAHLIAWL